MPNFSLEVKFSLVRAIDLDLWPGDQVEMFVRNAETDFR